MQIESFRVGGAITYWKGGATDRAKLAQCGEYIAKVMPKVSQVSALRGALTKCLKGKRKFLVRPTAKENTLAVVYEEMNGEDMPHNDYDHDCSAWVNKDGDVMIYPSHPEIDAVRAQYQINLSVLSPSAIGTMLAKLVDDRCDGLTLRESGGVYWIPKYTIPMWGQIGQAFEACAIEKQTTLVYCIHAVADQDMVRSIGDALTTEITSECHAMLEEVQSGNLGVEATDRRVERADALVSKVSRYESLFATPLETLRKSLEEVRGAAVLAKIEASAAHVRSVT